MGAGEWPHNSQQNSEAGKTQGLVEDPHIFVIVWHCTKLRLPQISDGHFTSAQLALAASGGDPELPHSEDPRIIVHQTAHVCACVCVCVFLNGFRACGLAQS